MNNTKGKPIHIDQVIFGKVVLQDTMKNQKKQNILVTDYINEVKAGYGAVIFNGAFSKNNYDCPLVILDDNSNHNLSLNENDIVAIYPNGEIILLYRQGWKDVTLFFTNQCNSRCIICPQTSNIEDKGNFLEFNKQLLDILPCEIEHIGITGGEPTVFKEDLIEIIKYIHEIYPNISISLLTNGRALKDKEFVVKLKAIGHKRMLFCIPLYAANHEQHDLIVGSKGAFIETIEGIYNLYKAQLLIEIRIVVFKYNFLWLNDFSSFLYRNFPFVRHVAFMGMEYTGNAANKLEDFWIDSYDYKKQLHAGVWFLHQRNMNVSIYNIPLCLLEKKSRIFARDSISSWKKMNLPICDNCSIKKQCSGFFETSIRQSKYFGIKVGAEIENNID